MTNRAVDRLNRLIAIYRIIEVGRLVSRWLCAPGIDVILLLKNGRTVWGDFKYLK